MYEKVNKPKENKNHAIANSVAQKKSNEKQGFEFMDNRPEAIAQRKLLESVENNLQLNQTDQQTIQNETSSIQSVKQPTTLIGTALVGTVAALGLGYAMYRRSGITVNLEGVPGRLANGRLEAAVKVQATGLKEGDWVDYQISWAQGAVPGFNGTEVVDPHLGQQAGRAGGWRTDQPPLRNTNPFIRIPENPRYEDQGDGTADFLFIDEIVQHVQMAQGLPNQRQWWFRAIVKNSWGIPIKMSNTVMIQWPRQNI